MVTMLLLVALDWLALDLWAGKAALVALGPMKTTLVASVPMEAALVASGPVKVALMAWESPLLASNLVPLDLVPREPKLGQVPLSLE